MMFEHVIVYLGAADRKKYCVACAFCGKAAFEKSIWHPLFRKIGSKCFVVHRDCCVALDVSGNVLVEPTIEKDWLNFTFCLVCSREGVDLVNCDRCMMSMCMNCGARYSCRETRSFYMKTVKEGSEHFCFLCKGMRVAKMLPGFMTNNDDYPQQMTPFLNVKGDFNVPHDAGISYVYTEPLRAKLVSSYVSNPFLNSVMTNPFRNNAQNLPGASSDKLLLPNAPQPPTNHAVAAVSSVAYVPQAQNTENKEQNSASSSSFVSQAKNDEQLKGASSSDNVSTVMVDNKDPRPVAEVENTEPRAPASSMVSCSIPQVGESNVQVAAAHSYANQSENVSQATVETNTQRSATSNSPVSHAQASVSSSNASSSSLNAHMQS